MNILFLSYFEYPGENACANRLNKIAQALKSSGHNLTIISVTSSTERNINNAGIDSDGITYKKIKTRNRPWDLTKLVSLFYDNFVFIQQVKAIRVNHKIDLVLGYGEQTIRYGAVRMYCSRWKISFIADLTEWYEFKISRLYSFQYLDHLLFRWYVLGKINGAIAISRFILQKCNNKHVPAILVPALCDGKEHPCVVEDEKKTFNVGYIGRLFKRDEPECMLEAIEICCNRESAIQFYIVGDTNSFSSKKSVAKIYEKIDKKRIVTTGFVDKKQYDRYLESIDVFILLRKPGLFSVASFPTRLPELLSRGKPVIISDVGDISLYLRHGQSAYIVPSGVHPEMVADGICELYTNKELYTTISSNAQKAALRSFNYMQYAQSLERFIEKVR